MKRRVIFINRFFHPDESATAVLLSDLAFHLAGRDWAIHVVTSSFLYTDPSANLPRREKVRGVTIHRVWSSRFGRGSVSGRACDYVTFYASATVKLLVLANRGTIVVAKTDPPLISLFAAACSSVRGSRLVNWLQDLYPEVAVEMGFAPRKGIATRLLSRLRNLSLRSSNAVVAIGERMRALLAKSGIEANKINVIPNWTDDHELRPLAGKSALRGEWDIPDDVMVVGYSGNLGRAHEAETLLGAARALRERGDILFLFVGGGHESEILKKRVAKEGLRNIRFEPYQPRSRLLETLSVPDLHWISLKPAFEGLIVPSKFYGIAAAGRPVIAIADPDGEIANIVRQYSCGRILEPGDVAGLVDCLTALAASAQLRKELGENARRAIDEEFSRQRALGKWEQLLEEVACA
jgi:colanic acid biosynthesis glycosyl transferase WcaI